MDSSQIVTMHIQSVDQNKAIKTIKRTITELDRSKIEEQKKAVRAGYDMDVLPSDLATYGRDASTFEGIAEPERENVSGDIPCSEHRQNRAGTGNQRVSGGQHCPEAQLRIMPP